MREGGRGEGEEPRPEQSPAGVHRSSPGTGSRPYGEERGGGNPYLSKLFARENLILLGFINNKLIPNPEVGRTKKNQTQNGKIKHM